MSYWIESDTVVTLVALLLSWLLISKIIKIAHICKLYDYNSPRKIHHGVIPRLGGVAFVPAVLFSVCLVLAILLSMGICGVGQEIYACGTGVLYLSCALMLLYIVGIADDLVDVSHSWKFTVQIMSAALIVASGNVIPTLGGLFGIDKLPLGVSWFLSGFLIVFIINAINFIDGIDGLATGLSIIALGFYSVVLSYAGYQLYAMIGCGTIGSIVAFFYFNVFGKTENSTKIFMGDSGSMTLGLILAFMGLTVSSLPANKAIWNINPFILAYSPLIIPAFDIVRVIIHRVMLKRSPFVADKVHIHHKLLALKYSQTVSLVVLIILSVVSLVGNILLSKFISVTLLLVLDVLVWTIGNILLTRIIKQRQEREGYHLFE